MSALKFKGEKIPPFVITTKKIYTRTRTISIAFFFNMSKYFAMTFSPYFFFLFDITSNMIATNTTIPLTTFW